MKEFELIEHTADIGIRAYGKDLPQLFVNAAKGLFSLITDASPPQDQEKTITLKGKFIEDLLISWLSELISGFFAYKFLPKSYNIRIEQAGVNSLEARIRGAKYDPYSEKVNMEVKAATYHGLKVKKTKQGFAADIIFDI
jgi:SHS2 domain-containing protein